MMLIHAIKHFHAAKSSEHTSYGGLLRAILRSTRRAPGVQRKVCDVEENFQGFEGIENDEVLGFFIAGLPMARLSSVSAVCVRNCRTHLCVQDNDSSSVLSEVSTVVWSARYHPKCVWVATSAGEVFFIQCDVPFQDATPENMANVIVDIKVTCAWCGSKKEDGGTFKKCMGCKLARYCSQKCQIRHWNAAHRNKCTVPGGGLYSIAAELCLLAHEHV